MNVAVNQQAAMARNVSARERALALADAGQSAEAAQVLEEQVRMNVALPSYAKDEKLMRDNERLEAAASELENAGSLGRAGRKQFQYESYEQKKQR
ncbi:MAG: hypothetical protein HC904_11340 [Blastochloris sp.]|nr:hypothetical protein [Blastochloris sp.]